MAISVKKYCSPIYIKIKTWIVFKFYKTSQRFRNIKGDDKNCKTVGYWDLPWELFEFHMRPALLLLLRSEIPSGMCAKFCTVAASNNRVHARYLSDYCLLALHILWCYSSRTSRSWWITQSTQHHRRGCNTTMRSHFQFWEQSCVRDSLQASRDMQFLVTYLKAL